MTDQWRHYWKAIVCDQPLLLVLLLVLLLTILLVMILDY